MAGHTAKPLNLLYNERGFNPGEANRPNRTNRYSHKPQQGLPGCRQVSCQTYNNFPIHLSISSRACARMHVLFQTLYIGAVLDTQSRFRANRPN
jgi:hypothetical protein